MQKETQEKYLSLFNSGEFLTQKEVATRLSITVSAASRNLRYLYERDLLKTKASPGMSLRYSRTKDFEVIRTPAGNPLYSLYDASLSKEEENALFLKLARTTSTHFIDSDLNREDISAFIKTTKNLLLLLEILENSSPDQLRATRQALIEAQGSE